MSEFLDELKRRTTRPEMIEAIEKAELNAVEKQVEKLFVDIAAKVPEEMKAEGQPAIQKAVVVQGPWLPQCETDKVPVPHCFQRSAFFAAVAEESKRKQLKNAIIAVQGDTTISYTGEQLAQDDKRLLHTLIDLARSHPLGTIVHTRGYALLKKLGRVDSAYNYFWLKTSADRLIANRVEIRIGKRVFSGNILSTCLRDEETDLYKFCFNPEFIKVYGAGEWTGINNEIVAKLGRSPLAQWIYGYALSHIGSTVSRDLLQRLSGCEDMPKKAFNQALKRAAKMLEERTDVRLAFRGDLVDITHDLTPAQGRHLIKALLKSKRTPPK